MRLLPQYDVIGQHVWQTEGSDLYFVARRYDSSRNDEALMQILIVSTTYPLKTTFDRSLHVTKILEHGQRIRERLGYIVWSREFKRPTHQEEQDLWLTIIQDPLPWFIEGML